MPSIRCYRWGYAGGLRGRAPNVTSTSGGATVASLAQNRAARAPVAAVVARAICRADRSAGSADRMRGARPCALMNSSSASACLCQALSRGCQAQRGSSSRSASWRSQSFARRWFLIHDRRRGGTPEGRRSYEQPPRSWRTSKLPVEADRAGVARRRRSTTAPRRARRR